MKLATMLVATVLSLQSGSTQNVGLVEASKVDICDVARHPAGLVGKHIVLHAEVLADGMHGALLMDDSGKCVVHLATPPKKPDRQSEAANEALAHAIWLGHPGTGDGKTISGDFDGILLMEKPDFGPPTNRKLPALQLLSLENLKVTGVFDPDSKQLPILSSQH